MVDLLKEFVLLFRELFLYFSKRKRTIQDSIEIGNKVDKILDVLIEDTGADRAYVFQFHNGSYFYTGNSIDKMTNTHEKVVTGVSHEQLKYRDVVTAPFRYFVENIIKNKVYDCGDPDSIPHYNTRLMITDRGVKAFKIVKMADSLNRLVGFVGLDYIKNEEVPLSANNHLLNAANSIYEILVYGRERK